MLTIFYSSQAPFKRVWNPHLPQINITEQCESLCKRRIIFEIPSERTLSFDIGTEKIQYIVKHIVHEREKCTPLRSYLSRALNVRVDLNVYGNVS